MISRILFATLFVLLSCVTCVGQTSYMGLTPGQSTRADVERVLGQPVKNVSKTLFEYADIVAVPWRFYVQYKNEPPTEIVERIERTCLRVPPARCESVGGAILLEGALEDALSRKDRPDGFVLVSYYGAPRFIVSTHIAKGINYEVRLAYYSKELYESAVPRSGCTGTIFGTWQTDRGRMTVQRVDDNGIQGTYSKNNGSFSLKQVSGGYMGEWKDDTGSGTMALMLRSRPGDSFNASLSRGSGASVSAKQTPARSDRSEIGAKVQSEIKKIENSKGAAIGAIARTPSETAETALLIGGLPPGEPLKGKCVP